MNRKFLGIIALLAAAGLAWVGFVMSGNSSRLNSLYISQEEWDSILARRSENPELSIESTTINNSKITSTNDSIFYSIIEGDKDPYNPLFTVLSQSLSVAVLGDKISAESIEQNIHQNIVFYNDENYRVFELVSTTLPVLNFNFSDGALPNSRNNEAFEMTLYDNRANIINRSVFSEGKAHKRGGSSYYSDKGSYKLKLSYESLGNNSRENPKPLLGMRESSEWVLQSLNTDYEKCRDFIAAKLWSQSAATRNNLGLDLSYENRFVEVITNGEYKGLYLLGSTPIQSLLDSEDANVEYPDIIYKIEGAEDYNGLLTDKSHTINTYELKSNTNQKKSDEVLVNYIRSLYGGSIENAEDYSDIDNAIFYSIFINLTQNIDIPRQEGMVKNSYVIFRWDGENYKAALAPWDFDMSMGTDSLFSSRVYNLNPETPVILTTDLIANYRRNGKTGYLSNINLKYVQLRQSTFTSKNILKIIDEAESYIFNSGAFLRDQQVNLKSHYSDPSKKLSYLREYMTQRLVYLDTFYSNQILDTLPIYHIPNYVRNYVDTGVILGKSDKNYEFSDDELADPSLIDNSFYISPGAIVSDYWNDFDENKPKDATENLTEYDTDFTEVSEW